MMLRDEQENNFVAKNSTQAHSFLSNIYIEKMHGVLESK